jgi:hydrogenase maturation protease
VTEGRVGQDPSCVVIGIGNPWRRDDGIGPAVADAINRGTGAPVAVVVLDGEPGRLLECWHGADVAVVVDAVRADDPPGTVRIFGTGPCPPVARASSHAFGITDAIELGRRLDQLPGRLIGIGVVGADFAHGQRLTPAVAAVVEPTARLVRLVVERERRRRIPGSSSQP